MTGEKTDIGYDKGVSIGSNKKLYNKISPQIMKLL